MRVTTRLYRQHDMDLIALYYNSNFSLPLASKEVLSAYVNGETFFIKPPSWEPPPRAISRVIMFHIELDDEHDKDVIEWLQRTKNGFRNGMIKNILRSYLAVPYLYPYFRENADVEKFVKYKGILTSKFEDAKIEFRTQDRNKRKKKLIGEELADKILGTPLNEITEKTLEDESGKAGETKDKEDNLYIKDPREVNVLDEDDAQDLWDSFDEMMGQ